LQLLHLLQLLLLLLRCAFASACSGGRRRLLHLLEVIQHYQRLLIRRILNGVW
jgi:hypothetical protein